MSSHFFLTSFSASASLTHAAATVNLTVLFWLQIGPPFNTKSQVFQISPLDFRRIRSPSCDRALVVGPGRLRPTLTLLTCLTPPGSDVS